MPEGNMCPEARIQALLQAPADGWAAFSENEDRLVAYGHTYDEAVENALKEGEAEPVLVKVPSVWMDRALAS